MNINKEQRLFWKNHNLTLLNFYIGYELIRTASSVLPTKRFSENFTDNLTDVKQSCIMLQVKKNKER